MDEIVSFLFGPLYFFARTVTTVKAGEPVTLWATSSREDDACLSSPLPAPSVLLGFLMVHNCHGKLASQMRSVPRATRIQPQWH